MMQRIYSALAHMIDIAPLNRSRKELSRSTKKPKDRVKNVELVINETITLRIKSIVTTRKRILNWTYTSHHCRSKKQLKKGKSTVSHIIIIITTIRVVVRE